MRAYWSRPATDHGQADDALIDRYPAGDAL
jgi:hypothetical protein